jgi:hypothetical protein
MKLIVPLLFCVLLLAGFASSCKHNPVVPPPTCDTCKKDTTCDTCKHDTIPKVSDTTSHNFTWTQSTIPIEAGLTGCWVFGTNSIYVVGGSVYKSTDGKNWTNVTPTDSRGVNLKGGLSGFSMFAFSENDYWLTGYGAMFHYNGTIAQLYEPDSLHSGSFHSMWGMSSTDMYAVGDGGTILHFDGSTWTKMQSGTTKDIAEIWGTSDANIWGSGWNEHTGSVVILHYDGAAWKTIDLTQVGNNIGYNPIIGVWTCDSTGHHKCYACGSFLYRNSDVSNTWVTDSGKIQNALSTGGYDPLNYIRGNASNDYMVEGGSGFVSHWNGNSWFLYSSMYNYNDANFDTYAFSFVGNTACQVGAKDGSGWVAIGQR